MFLEHLVFLHRDTNERTSKPVLAVVVDKCSNDRERERGRESQLE